MASVRKQQLFCSVFVLILALSVATPAFGADDETKSDEETTQASTNEATPDETPPLSSTKTKTPHHKEKRKYITENPERSDAGIFHVGFAGGGNFYVEPQVDSSGNPNGQYFTDFGGQVGVYFDYDYSEVETNIPLMLRGMVGYKYVLNSVNVFTFDGVAERVFRLSEYASFGIGAGASAAVWYRVGNDGTNGQIPSTMQVIFLPSMIVAMGFQFDPFMVDFKWLINRFGQNSTITGFELYFGFRL